MSTQELFPGMIAFLITAAVCGPFARGTQGAGVTYTIDSGQSVLNLSGSYSGFQLSPQTPGSMGDHFGGTITADWNDGVLSFSGGSSIGALDNNAGPFQPMASGAPGSADGNYGVAIPGIGELGAYRNVAFNILSGVVMDDAAPSLTLSYTSGVLDYAGPATGPGQLNFAGVSGTDSSGTSGSRSSGCNRGSGPCPRTSACTSDGSDRCARGIRSR